MAQVFVSRSTEDVAIAQQVVATLKAGGVGIWIAPDSIPPGVAYNEAIVAGLRASDTLAVRVSKAANANDIGGQFAGLLGRSNYFKLTRIS
jgi:hypothetical protein